MTEKVKRVNDIYILNEEFRRYMNHFLHNNEHITLSQAFEHVIIQDIAEYYLEKEKNKDGK